MTPEANQVLSVSLPRKEAMNLEKEKVPTTPHDAAVAMQKFYRGYRTRRQLADCAVLARDYDWWNVLEGVILRQNSEQFYNDEHHDAVAAKWTRAGKKAAKLGRGLSKDEGARKLAFQHWLEAIDARHRYGHNLSYYFDAWRNTDTRQPFFYWLDVGDGRNVDLKECPRAKLNKDQISYLGPRERKLYEVSIEDGKWYYRQTGEIIDTSGDERWIFVMSPSQSVYTARKQKGKFQHSSFLAGGAAKAAGRLSIRNGDLELVEPHSGHYRPTQKNFESFLEILRSKGIDLENKVQFTSHEMARAHVKSLKREKSGQEDSEVCSASTVAEELHQDGQKQLMTEVIDVLKSEQRQVPGGEAPVAENTQVPQKDEHKEEDVEQNQAQQKTFKFRRPSRLQLKRQSSSTWCSEGGCRLSSLSIIPPSLRTQALEVMQTPRQATVRW